MTYCMKINLKGINMSLITRKNPPSVYEVLLLEKIITKHIEDNNLSCIYDVDENIIQQKFDEVMDGIEKYITNPDYKNDKT